MWRYSKISISIPVLNMIEYYPICKLLAVVAIASNGGSHLGLLMEQVEMGFVEWVVMRAVFEWVKMGFSI